MGKIPRILLITFCLSFLGVNIKAVSKNSDIYNENMGYKNFQSKNFKSYSCKTDESIGKQLIMRAIKDGLENKQAIINLDNYIKYFKNKSDYKIPMEYYYDTLDKYPEIFYSEVTVDCDASYDKSTGEIVSYNLLVNYIYDNKTIDTMKTKFNNRVQEIKKNYLSKATTELEKEYIIHDYIIENCTYDKENYYKNTVPSIEHTAYGALVNGISVCDGYAKAAQLLLRDSNIESGVVVSEEMNHAWNYVLIDGYYYFLDLTWDDWQGNEEEAIYKYFNVTSSELKSGTNPHKWNEVEYPICFNDRFNFLKNGYKFKRFEDKMYYSDLKNKKYFIYAIDLQGKNENLVNNNDYTLDIEVDKNNLYCLNFNYDASDKRVYYLYKFNPINKKKERIFVFSGAFDDMYKRGSNLIIKYNENGIKKTKTLGLTN
ncbi:hypothetical protein NNC19_07995 [Clostridium sp. SHJSY1]|uniref:transglutaminase domain-containing protein n=1 Tax=Clostridium sp. SHJSY1 TaxID=2942483 RepID=UPI002874AF92|nr:transglutaminase domain-containing protein [Clostridium sp. SHJSY1]MDS0525615.1 hypothetical protein [Clostridium sp. SHJSY1]